MIRTLKLRTVVLLLSGRRWGWALRSLVTTTMYRPNQLPEVIECRKRTLEVQREARSPHGFDRGSRYWNDGIVADTVGLDMCCAGPEGGQEGDLEGLHSYSNSWYQNEELEIVRDEKDRTRGEVGLAVLHICLIT